MNGVTVLCIRLGQALLRLYLVRHGQSTNNADPNFEKHEFDPPLTKLGVQQSQAVAKHLKFACDTDALRHGYDIQKIYTSPQLRALLTTQPIARVFDIRPQIWVKIHERGGVAILHRRGILQHHGLTRSEIMKQFPTFKIPTDVTANGWWRGTPDLESQEEVKVRAQSVANDLLIQSRRASDVGVLMISHGTFLNVLMQSVLQDSHNRYLHYNTGISRIDIDRGTQAKLVYLNRTAHLNQQWIS